VHVFEEYRSKYNPEETKRLWTAMIQAYQIQGQGNQAIKFFEEMHTLGIAPSESTFSIILSIAAEMSDLSTGQRIHMMLKVNSNFFKQKE
jgi:pentatricopeptide repeat protein